MANNNHRRPNPWSLASAGHVAQTFGAYRIGHLARAAGTFGIGAEAASFSELAAVVAPLAAAFAGITVAAKLVETGLTAVAQTATQLVGAISQIGGAKNLQQMLVESSSIERMSANIAANITDNMSRSDVMKMITSISQGTEFGRDDIADMLSAFKGRTGSIAEMQQLGKFGANLSSVSGLSTGETGDLLGQLRAQFPELSTGGLQQAAINLWGLGRSGAVELKNATSVSQALGLARFVSPDTLAGLNLEMGLTQKAQIYTGGQSADEAVTSVRRLQQDLQNAAPGSKKYEAIASILGQGFLTHSDTGQQVLANAPEAFAKLALGAYEGKIGTNVFDARAIKSLQGIASSAAAEFKPGMSEKEKQDILTQEITKLKDTNIAMDEFDGKLKDVKDTVEYQFKESFNHLSIELEGVLLPVLKEMVPVVKLFADTLVSDKDKVRDFLLQMVGWLAVAVEKLPQFIDVMGMLMRGVGSAAAWIINHTGGSMATSADEAITNIQRDISEQKYAGKIDERTGKMINPGRYKTLEEDIKKQKADLQMWQEIAGFSKQNMTSGAAAVQASMATAVNQAVATANATTAKTDTTVYHPSTPTKTQIESAPGIEALLKEIRDHLSPHIQPPKTTSH